MRTNLGHRTVNVIIDHNSWMHSHWRHCYLGRGTTVQC